MMRSKYMILCGCLMLILLNTSCSKVAQETDTTSTPTENETTQDTQTASPNETPSPDDQTDLLDTPSTIFTHSPVPTDSLTGIVPLGNVNPNGGHTLPTKHMYFYLTQDEQGKTFSVPLVSPGNITITGVAKMSYINASPPRSDYTINFQLSAKIHGYLMHVQGLSESILNTIGDFGAPVQEYGTGEYEMKRYFKSVSIPLSGGDPIGTVGGHEEAWSFDFGLYDETRPPLPFAKPARYRSGDQLHIRAALDYYEEPLKSQLFAYLGSYDGSENRTELPRTGEYEKDELGTAQGNWFKTSEGYADPEDDHLSLTPYNVHSGKATASFGKSSGLSHAGSGFYPFTVTQSGRVNRPFKEITADGLIYCIDLDEIYYFIRVYSADILWIEQREGTPDNDPSNWAFSDQKKMFYR